MAFVKFPFSLQLFSFKGRVFFCRRLFYIFNYTYLYSFIKLLTLCYVGYIVEFRAKYLLLINFLKIIKFFFSRILSVVFSSIITLCCSLYRGTSRTTLRKRTRSTYARAWRNSNPAVDRKIFRYIYLHTEKYFWFLLNQTEIGLYIPFADWFGTNFKSVWLQIN